MVISLAIALAALSLFVIRLRQPVHYLIYPFAALSVMPVWLIEQRYYFPAFALFMLFRESASPGRRARDGGRERISGDLPVRRRGAGLVLPVEARTFSLSAPADTATR